VGDGNAHLQLIVVRSANLLNLLILLLTSFLESTIVRPSPSTDGGELRPVLTLLVIVLLVLVAGTCVIGYQLILQTGKVLLRVETVELELKKRGILPDPGLKGAPLGSVLAEFVLPLLSGGEMCLSQWRGAKALLIFVDPRCEFSGELLEKLARRSNEPKGCMPLIISTGDRAENQQLVERLRFPYPVLLQEEGEVASMYNVRATPAGYLVDDVGRTASDLVIGVEPLLNLIHAPAEPSAPDGVGKFTRPLTDSRIARSGLKAGTPAPSFQLPDLNGREVKLEDFRDRNVLLVFSDPGCAPCMRLAPELERVHRKRRDLHVIVISRGDPEANRRKAAELELTFPIALQRHWEVSKAYGMFATPIAYLIDQMGIVVADVVAGGEAILELASRAEDNVLGFSKTSAVELHRPPATAFGHKQ
jgi:peroxiredoxin